MMAVPPVFNPEKISDFSVVIASSAEEAVQKFQEESFDVMVTDIMMEGISGGEAVALLRRQGQLKCPVIFMSGVISRQKTINIAGDNYPALGKPFTIEQLVERIQEVIQ